MCLHSPLDSSLASGANLDEWSGRRSSFQKPLSARSTRLLTPSRCLQQSLAFQQWDISEQGLLLSKMLSRSCSGRTPQLPHCQLADHAHQLSASWILVAQGSSSHSALFCSSQRDGTSSLRAFHSLQPPTAQAAALKPKSRAGKCINTIPSKGRQSCCCLSSHPAFLQAPCSFCPALTPPCKSSWWL